MSKVGSFLSLLRPRWPAAPTTAHRLERAVSVSDLRALARRRQPRGVFDYTDGGAEDEVSLRRSTEAFEHLELVPRALVDVSNIDTTTTLMGAALDLPLVCSPTGFTRMMHPDGESAVAQAAARAGTVFTLSSLATTTIEDVARAAPDADHWYQIYVWKDRGITREFIQRCREAGYRALVLTVDVPVFGRRERDLRRGMTIPPHIGPRMLLDGMRHPRWTWRFLTSDPITFANVAHRAEGPGDAVALGEYVNSQIDPAVTWRDAEWMLEEWGGPFVIKGIQRVDDAVRAAELGFGAIMVSNHGGRQLDHAPTPLELLPHVVDAVDGRAEVILDGGVRRGTDIVKAMALGARACAVGRALLYGLGAGGAPGVDRAFELLTDELRRDLALVGCPRVTELDRSFVRSRPPAGIPSVR